MAARFGRVLYWTATAAAIIAAAGLIFTGMADKSASTAWVLVAAALVSGVIWGAGRAARYVLAGE
jgi:hypothetical protein